MKAIAVNFGCKVSQSDAFETIRILVDTGEVTRVLTFDQADIIIIYCCCVTGRGAQKVRQRVRKLARDNSRARIILCGCYPTAYLTELKTSTGIDDIVPGHNPEAILDLLDITGSVNESTRNHTVTEATSSDGLRMRSRGILKIQDGCSGTCAYCIVRHIRGTPASMPVSLVLSRLQYLVRAGFEEIVLAGVNLASYGSDLSPPGSLTRLIESIHELEGVFRIRLSSLEPQWITADLIDTMAASDIVCPHFHLPLQSGDDRVLRRMNREYTVDSYKKTVSLIEERFDDFGLGTDIMVGFPGETEQEFENTRRLVEELPFTYLHVFRYSPRPGTQAAALNDDVLPAVKKDRSRILHDLEGEKIDHVLKKASGTIHEAVVINEGPPASLLTGTYLTGKLTNRNTPADMGKLLRVRITGYKQGTLLCSAL